MNLFDLILESFQVKEECGESAAGGGRQEDETPWGALASLAIFKLFNDWQSQGCVLPPDVLNVPTANMARSFMAQAAQQVSYTKCSLKWVCQ